MLFLLMAYFTMSLLGVIGVVLSLLAMAQDRLPSSGPFEAACILLLGAIVLFPLVRNELR